MGKNTPDKVVIATTFDEQTLRRMDPLLGHYDVPFRNRSDLIRTAVERLLDEYGKDSNG